jgi:hypothetical protein
MREVMTQLFFGILTIVITVGIKMMDMPAVITGLLTVIIFLVGVYGIAGGFTKKTSLEKRTEEKIIRKEEQVESNRA